MTMIPTFVCPKCASTTVAAVPVRWSCARCGEPADEQAQRERVRGLLREAWAGRRGTRKSDDAAGESRSVSVSFSHTDTTTHSSTPGGDSK